MRTIRLHRLSGKPPLFAMVDDDMHDNLLKVSWHIRSGYAATGIGNNKQKPMHRHIMEMRLGRPLLQSEEVDHIDGNPLNNQSSNLRVCSRQQNAHNTRQHFDAKKPYKGINDADRHGRWDARICVNYKNIYSYIHAETPEEAAAEYDLLAIKYAGRFAKLNFEDRRQEYIDKVKAGWEPTPSRPLSSQYKHVIFINTKKRAFKPWFAAIQENKKQKSIGFFKTELEAAEHADLYLLQRDGEKAELNFPERKEEYLQKLASGYNPIVRHTKSSKYTGVCKENKERNPWRSYVEKNGKRTELGNFATEQEAYEARQTWIRTHPECTGMK